MIRLPLRLSLAAAALAAMTAGAHAQALAPMQSLAGERCQLSRLPTLASPADVVCGTPAAMAGAVSLSALPALPAAPMDRLAILSKAGLAVRGQSGEDASCAPAEWIGGEHRIAMALCKLTANGWPQIVIIAAGPDALIEAHGLPSALPVLVQAAARLAPADARSASDAGLVLLKSKIPQNLLTAKASAAALYRGDIEVARLAGGTGDFAAAEAGYRRVVDAETALFGPNSVQIGQALSELALQVSNQGRFDEADKLFARAQPILEGASDPAIRARLYAYEALDKANQRKFGEALKIARQATAERRALVQAAAAENSTAAQGELSHSLRLEAEMALRLGDLPAARAAADEALWIVLEEPGLPLWWRPDTLELVGDVDAATGRVVAAEKNLKAAAKLDRSLFGDTARSANALMHLGAFYAGQEVYSAALASYRDAFAILARIKSAGVAVTADQILPYFRAAESLPEAGRPQAEMFAAAQLVSRGVNDQTILRMAARTAASNPALAAQVKAQQDAERQASEARLDLAAEIAKPDEDRNAARIGELQKRLTEASTQYEARTKALAVSFPAYASLAGNLSVKLADVEQDLAPNEAMLSFVAGQNGSYGLLVTKTGLVSHYIDLPAAQLASEVAHLREAVTVRLGQVGAFDTKSAHMLYDKLVAPFEPQLVNVDTLIAVPSGALASLPLSLLVTDAHEAGGKTAWLVRRFAIAEVPSARGFVALHRAAIEAKPAPQAILAIGAPSFGGGKLAALNALASECLSGGPVPAALLRSLPPLPDTAGEVRAAVTALGGRPSDILLGGEATEGNLRARKLSDYRVLYFATHGLLPGELHCQSEPGLALSPPATTTSSQNDGLLTASEVAGLDLNASLVVLSACNTGASGTSELGGGALFGLADAFFQAGARQVLATQWPIPSAATAKLMGALFSSRAAMSTGAYAMALRAAQLAILDAPQTGHPFYWAAFTLIGTGNAPVQAQAQAQAQARIAQ